MHNRSGRAGLITAGIFAAQGISALGQESLRNSLEFERMNEQRQNAFRQQFYNLKLGPVLFDTTAGLTISYSDNINASDLSPLEDVIIRPTAQLGFIWPMTEYNTLSVNTVVGYSKYINHPEFDRPDISPGSTSDISYDFSVGAFRFNLHDRFSYSQDPFQYGTGAVAGQADLGRFRNSVGVMGSLPMRDSVLSFGYDHSNYVLFNDSFQNSDYSSEMVFTRLTYRWNPVLQVGAEATGGLTDYEENFRTDNQNYTFGPFFDWKVNSAITVTARGGLSGYQLSAVGALGDVSAPLSYYASIDVQHTATRWMTHTLSLGRDTSQGIGESSNFLETMYVRHSASFRVVRNVGISTQLFYEYSGDSAQGVGLFLRESYSRIGGGITLSYQIMPKLSSSLSYTRIDKDSSVARLGYSANSVTLGLNYHF